MGRAGMARSSWRLRTYVGRTTGASVQDDAETPGNHPSGRSYPRSTADADAQPGRPRLRIGSAVTGVTLTLAAAPPEECDPRLSETMREAILTAVTVPAAKAPNRGADAAPAAERVAVHAVALRALLIEASSVLSPAEQQLLGDWLDRLATATNPGAPMRRSHRGTRSAGRLK
jgi:hypothetical protein